MLLIKIYNKNMYCLHRSSHMTSYELHGYWKMIKSGIIREGPYTKPALKSCNIGRRLVIASQSRSSEVSLWTKGLTALAMYCKDFGPYILFECIFSIIFSLFWFLVHVVIVIECGVTVCQILNYIQYGLYIDITLKTNSWIVHFPRRE